MGDEYAGAVTLDLGALDRVLEVDETSRAARIQAGALGPALEDQLRPTGLTLRHFPQSFEFSTLGGWIATRAGRPLRDTADPHRRPRRVGAGDHARRASGRAGGCPARAPGPSPDRMLIGSEGTLGVITEAWVRLQRAPRLEGVRGASRSTDFAAGAERSASPLAVGPQPSNCRLLDATESEVTGAGPAGKALLVLGFESAHHPVDGSMALALGGRRRPRRRAAARRREGGASAVESWRDAFLAAPYLRDTFVSLGVLSDTFETAITWDRFEEFHADRDGGGGCRGSRGLRRAARAGSALRG